MHENMSYSGGAQESTQQQHMLFSMPFHHFEVGDETKKEKY